MKLLLVSTYELGHQPLHVASPAAALRAAGHELRALDLAIESLNWDDVAWADAVAISVPMHTAMKLAIDVASRIKHRLHRPICLYGLYAAVGQDRVAGVIADRIIAGEYETALVGWANAFGTDGATGVSVELVKTQFVVPARDLLPPLDGYARLSVDGELRIAGYVEASHGCRHRCGHCPIPALYDGLFRIVGVDVVLADIAQLVEMGARHITFGDPDFFNGPRHAMRILEASYERFPELTYDITVKVEHILNHHDVWTRVGELGVIFAVSAFESTNNAVLEILDKGHTVDDMAKAVEIMRSAGIEIRPSWLPFTPWTTAEDIVDMFRFVAHHQVATDPIQFSIRLLIPDRSVLLGRPELHAHLGEYDPGRLTHSWEPIDDRTDKLAKVFAEHIEHSTSSGASDADIIEGLWFMALDAAGLPPESLEMGGMEGRPRLTEPWFC